jgi:hypothetical protein
VRAPATEAFGLRETHRSTIITLSNPTPEQIRTASQHATLVLPSNTFTDAPGLKMNFAAYEMSGPNVTSWLLFNTSTDKFPGAVPANGSETIGRLVLRPTPGT